MAIKIITPNTNISTGSINTNFIKDAAVTTAKILDANVTVVKMAANSVDSDQYVDGSIDTAHIGDDQDKYNWCFKRTSINIQLNIR